MVNIIVLATTNNNKIKEFRSLLRDFPVEFSSLADFGPIPPAIEDGNTFDENAYKKAHHVAKVLGLPAIADDSGLVVETLGGRPGVHSARFAGSSASDDDNVAKLLDEMEGKDNRNAFFQCTISIAVPSGPALTYEAVCAGKITTERKGESGFGYDPVFYHEGLGKTFAQATMEEKNAVSHRGQVMREIRSEFEKILTWLKLRLEEEKPEKPDHNQFLDNDWSNR